MGAKQAACAIALVGTFASASLAACAAVLGYDHVHAERGDGGEDSEVPEGGACASDMMVCSGSCIDPMKDERHCGRCDHACGGLGCEQGACNGEVIASNQSGNSQILHVGTFVYWSSTSGVVRCSDSN